MKKWFDNEGPFSIKALFITFLLTAVIIFVWGLVTTVLWAWVIPDVFPLMVKNGYLPATLTLIQGIKLSILILFTLSIAGWFIK
jgi:hypothetical protein